MPKNIVNSLFLRCVRLSASETKPIEFETRLRFVCIWFDMCIDFSHENCQRFFVRDATDNVQLLMSFICYFDNSLLLSFGWARLIAYIFIWIVLFRGFSTL